MSASSVSSRVDVESPLVVADPFHRLRIGGLAAADEPANLASETSVWANPIAATRADESRHLQAVPTTTNVAAASASASSLHGSVVAPLVNRFGQTPPVLLANHLTVVRGMQQQVHMFKHHMRQFIECFVKYTSARESSESHSSVGATPAAAPTGLMRDVRESMNALYLSHSTLLAPLLSTSMVSVNGRLLSKKDMFDLLDARFYSASFDLPTGLNAAARLAEPSYHMNGEVYSGEASAADGPTPPPPPPSARYRLATSTLGVMRPFLGDDGTNDDEQVGQAGRTTPAEEKDSKRMEVDVDARSVVSLSPAPSIPDLLSSAARTFNLHSATLLNLVQCSGLNPFTEMQQLIRREYVLPVTESSVIPSSRPALVSPLASTYVSALDASLLQYLSQQYEKLQPICRALEQRHAEDTRRLRDAQRAAQPPPPQAQLDRIVAPRPTLPTLPFVRKVYTTAAMASPYAPVGGATDAHSNPIAGVIFTLPHIMHVYIEFEPDDDPDHSATTPADIVGRAFDIPRIAVVHPTEIASLVDAHAVSAYAMHRDIHAQATSMLWHIKQRVDDETDQQRREMKNVAPARQLRVMQYLMLWLCSYWDLYIRPCVACKLHLAYTSPHGISLSHAAFASRNPAAAAFAPIPNDAPVLTQPTVRLLTHDPTTHPNAHTTVSLHTGCIELWRQQGANHTNGRG